MPDLLCGNVQEFPKQDGGIVRIEHRLPVALHHYYPLPVFEFGAASTIPLYRGEFIVDGKTWDGVVEFSMSARPDAVAAGERQTSTSDFPHSVFATGAAWVEPPTFVLPAADSGLPVPPPDPEFLPSGEGWHSTITGYSIGAGEVGDGSRLTRATFFIPNGWTASDGSNVCCDGQIRAGSLRVSTDGWRLRIDPRGDVPEDTLRSSMRDTQVHTVTHIGEVERADGSDFTAAELHDLLNVLATAFTLLLGRATAPVLPVGWVDDRAVYAKWGSSRAVDRPASSMSWRDTAFAVEQAAEVVERCLTIAGDALLWEVLQQALGYYLSANYEATVNMKVTLPVPAITLLSFVYFTDVVPASAAQGMSRGAMRDLSAEETLRKYLGAMGLSTAIPTHLRHLLAVQKTLTTIDPATGQPEAPDALTCVIKMRNEVMHPKRGNVKKWSIYEWGEASFAAIHMLEAGLLFWIGYRGRYIPTTALQRGMGSAISVPWNR